MLLNHLDYLTITINIFTLGFPSISKGSEKSSCQLYFWYNLPLFSFMVNHYFSDHLLALERPKLYPALMQCFNITGGLCKFAHLSKTCKEGLRAKLHTEFLMMKIDAMPIRYSPPSMPVLISIDLLSKTHS